MRKNREIGEEYSFLLRSWVKKHNVKVGDRVKVTRIPNSWELFNDTWVCSMDKHVGQTMKVKKLTDDEICLDGSPYSFPYFVLEIVPARTIDYLNGEVLTYRYRGSERKWKFIRTDELSDNYGTYKYILVEEGSWVTIHRGYSGDEEVPQTIGLYTLVEEGK